MNPLKPFVLSALSLLMAGAALAQKPAWIEVRRHGEPETAFVGGHTADGQDLYVCRVVNSGDIESGKRVGVQGGTCYVGSYDMERPYSYFEILYGVDPAATWVPFDGAMPENAFRGFFTPPYRPPRSPAFLFFLSLRGAVLKSKSKALKI